MWKLALILVLMVAVYTDWRWHRIYNWLTVPALGIGLVLSLVTGGLPGLGASLAGAAVAFVVFLILYRVAHMGAGDLKLMVAIGAWLGYAHIWAALLSVALAGGLFAAAIAVRHGALRTVAWNVYHAVSSFFIPGAKPAAFLAKSALPPFPYGVAIAAGTLVVLVSPGVLGGAL